VIVTLLVLGLGTGAATTVFTIVDSVVLRPLPYRAPDRLVTLWDTNAEQGLAHDPISPVTFLDYRALPPIEDAAAWWRPGINLVDPGLDPVRVDTIETSANLFAVLGVGPQLGTGFGKGEPLHALDEDVVVISDRLWRTRYGADPDIIGRALDLSGEPHRVLGVMPPGFHFPDDVDVWQRLSWDLAGHSRHAHFMEGVARLAEGATLAEAQAAADALTLRLGEEHAESNRGWGVRLVPLLDEQLGYYRPALMVLFGAVGLLLAVGVLNVASLLLTRALSRDREMAVRIALGASPWQLVAQLLAESLVLSLAGAAAGVLAARALLPLLVRFAPVEIPRLADAALDWNALAAAGGVVALTTLLFGLVPALLLLRSKTTAELKAGERGSTRRARAIYSVLVTAELALACGLLVSSALLVRTVRQMVETPTGVDAAEVLTAKLQIVREDGEGAAAILAGWEKVGATHSRILEALRGQPGVEFAGASNFLPFEVGWRDPIPVMGQPPPPRPEDAPQSQMHSVSEGWFEAMGARVVAGRAFGPADGPCAPPVVIVNETFARRFLPEGAVGERIWFQGTNVGPLGSYLPNLRVRIALGRHSESHYPTSEVVGVVADVRNAPIGQESEPAVYFTTRQFPFGEVYVAVRARGEGQPALDALRAAVREVSPSTPVGDVRTWGERFAEHTAEQRLLMATLTAFGALAALLAAIGVYGLVSWSVALRTRELAIRLALGARPVSVARLVVRQSLSLVGLGVALGFGLVRLAESALVRVLYEVSPNDLSSTAAAGSVLAVAALAACLPPARRAMRVDPVDRLRPD
jgi:predicted permease